MSCYQFLLCKRGKWAKERSVGETIKNEELIKILQKVKKTGKGILFQEGFFVPVDFFFFSHIMPQRLQES